MQTTRFCSQCGSAFTVPFLSTRKKRCNACRYRDRKTRADKGARKADWVTVSCSNCGKSFEKRPGDVRKSQKKEWKFYCSYQCRDACSEQHTGRPPSSHKSLHAEGYVKIYVPIDERPKCNSRKSRFLEHRIVMARVLGRELLPTETVHHIDGDKTNNAPENLQLRNGRHGKGSHFRCRACGSTDIEAVSFKES